MENQPKHNLLAPVVACLAIIATLYLPTTGAAEQPRAPGKQPFAEQMRKQLVAAPVSRPKRAGSKIQQAAHGHMIAEPLPEVIHSSHFMEPSCGIEGCNSCCDSGPSFSGPSLMAGPSCGMEPGCGLEACGTCGPRGCDSGGAVCFDECYPLMVPIKRINWSNFEFFGGVHSFSGPPNYAGVGNFANERDGSASFGIHEGFNFSRPSFLLGGGLSSQFGLRATQSNPSGSEFTDESRQQIFLTGGLFRRVDYGFQGGVVFDYLFDDWYYNVNVTQLRSNLSWKLDPGNEFGYQYFASLSDDMSDGTIRTPNGAGGFNVATVMLNIESVDQHRFYYRRYFNRGGAGELFAGATGSSDGLLGASLDIPLVDSLSMRTGITYLNPDVSTGQIDSQEESWNLSWTFVWHPCGINARGCYDRPMFEVADNGTLMVDRR